MQHISQRLEHTEPVAHAKGYPWFHISIGRTRILSLAVILVGIGAASIFYIWYSRYSNDLAPDSIAGYLYAFLGTTCLVLAGVLYSRRRRSHNKRTIGQLQGALDWHICFAILGLFFLLLHTFGNFNPRSGTYALYGLIALTVSGFTGRLLDRFLPRLIAGQVHKALNAQGDDRIETISQKLQSLVTHNTQELQGFTGRDTPGNHSTGRSQGSSPTIDQVPELETSVSTSPFDSIDDSGQPLHSPWDLAYISLEALPQELSRSAVHYRFIPDKKSRLTRPGALMPGTQEQIAALHDVQKALQYEQVYRYMIRYWRKFHVALALLTLGLIAWHLLYAAQLLLPALLHR